jgi:cytochrome P450 family 12
VSSDLNPMYFYRRTSGQPPGILFENDEAWWAARCAVNKPMTSPGAAHVYMPLQDPVSQDLVDRIRFTRDRDSFQVKDNFINELYKYALESVLAVCFDKVKSTIRQIISETNTINL